MPVRRRCRQGRQGIADGLLHLCRPSLAFAQPPTAQGNRATVGASEFSVLSMLALLQGHVASERERQKT